jgi:hypothetical protein
LTTNGIRVPLKWLKPLPDQKIALRVDYPENSAARVFAVYLD